MNRQIKKESENIDDFLNALGAALLEWQSVESNLFLIFNFLVGTHRNPAILSAVYHSVVNITPRLKMTNAAAAIVLKDNPYLQEWTNLYEKIRDNANNRNKLAHFGLAKHITKGKSKLFLKPSIFDYNANHNCEYDVKQIDKWRMAFIDLSSDLSKFLNNLPANLQKGR